MRSARCGPVQELSGGILQPQSASSRDASGPREIPWVHTSPDTISMMMSRFVERVINSPSQSVEQVDLQMSCERRGERVADRRAVGELLFKRTEFATAKILVPSVVVVLGTDVQ